MGMMTIRGIYAKHGVRSLNHGIGYNGAAIELLLPTYGEELGLKGKICTHWVLNPHPTLIPAIESGWVQKVCAFGGELGMDRYTAARPDIFFTGSDGALRSNRAAAQVARSVRHGPVPRRNTADRLCGQFLHGDKRPPQRLWRCSQYGQCLRRTAAHHQAWCEMAPKNGSMASGRKLVVQMMKSSSKFGPGFVPELEAVKIGKKAGMAAAPVMIYGEDVTHVVTEQGIAYLYEAETPEERTKLLACVAQGTPLGEQVSEAQIPGPAQDRLDRLSGGPGN